MNIKIAVLPFGPPACGKGTLGKRLKQVGFQNFVMRELLKAKERDDPEWAKKHPISSTIDAGHLCCDEAVIDSFQWVLSAVSAERLYLDGFLRSARQAYQFIVTLRKAGYSIVPLRFECSRESIIRRNQNPDRADRDDAANIETRIRLAAEREEAVIEMISNLGYPVYTINAEESPEGVEEQTYYHMVTACGNGLRLGVSVGVPVTVE